MKKGIGFVFTLVWFLFSGAFAASRRFELPAQEPVQYPPAGVRYTLIVFGVAIVVCLIVRRKKARAEKAMEDKARLEEFRNREREKEREKEREREKSESLRSGPTKAQMEFAQLRQAAKEQVAREESEKAYASRPTVQSQEPQINGSEWHWEISEARLEKAKSNNEIRLYTLNKDAKTAEFVGRDGEVYRVSLSSCTCPDFQYRRNRKLACKHMIRLGMELDVLDENGVPIDDKNQRIDAEQRQEIGILSESSNERKVVSRITKPDGEYLFEIASESNERNAKKSNVLLSEDEAEVLLKLLFRQYFSFDGEEIVLVNHPVKESMNVQTDPQQDIYHDIMSRLNKENIEYIDKSKAGGGLYFFDDALALDLIQAGYPIRRAPYGTKSTSGKAAWFLRKADSQRSKG